MRPFKLLYKTFPNLLFSLNKTLSPTLYVQFPHSIGLDGLIFCIYLLILLTPYNPSYPKHKMISSSFFSKIDSFKVDINPFACNLSNIFSSNSLTRVHISSKIALSFARYGVDSSYTDFLSTKYLAKLNQFPNFIASIWYISPINKYAFALHFSNRFKTSSLHTVLHSSKITRSYFFQLYPFFK